MIRITYPGLFRHLSVCVLSILSLALASCSTSGSDACSSGLICPPGKSCSADGLSCITGQCGDNIKQDQEECDDGNTQSGDGCSSDCTSRETCGNGVVDVLEACDDGNALNGDRCSSDCMLSAECGNGNLDDKEECDDKNNRDDDDCSSICKLSFCGDGHWNQSGAHREECDPSTGDELCTPNCKRPQCSDGIVTSKAEEQCDPPGLHDGLNCDGNCHIAFCGNGQPDDGEECDDGNWTDTDACRSNCRTNICGDGLLNPLGEECDSGPNNGKSSCPYGERECEVCTTACKRRHLTGSFCGDGKVDAVVEECDFGPACGRCIQCKYLNAASATGQIIVKGRPSESGTVIVIGDGVRLPVTFEFKNNCSGGLSHFSCGDATDQQPYCCVERGSASDENHELIESFMEAIGAATNRHLLDVTVSDTGDPRKLKITHNSAGAGGNQIINTNNTTAFAVSGLSGGVGFSCPKGSPCRESSDCADNRSCGADHKCQ